MAVETSKLAQELTTLKANYPDLYKALQDNAYNQVQLPFGGNVKHFFKDYNNPTDLANVIDDATSSAELVHDYASKLNAAHLANPELTGKLVSLIPLDSLRNPAAGATVSYNNKELASELLKPDNFAFFSEVYNANKGTVDALLADPAKLQQLAATLSGTKEGAEFSAKAVTPAIQFLKATRDKNPELFDKALSSSINGGELSETGKILVDNKVAFTALANEVAALPEVLRAPIEAGIKSGSAATLNPADLNALAQKSPALTANLKSINDGIKNGSLDPQVIANALSRFQPQEAQNNGKLIDTLNQLEAVTKPETFNKIYGTVVSLNEFQSALAASGASIELQSAINAKIESASKGEGASLGKVEELAASFDSINQSLAVTTAKLKDPAQAENVKALLEAAVSGSAGDAAFDLRSLDPESMEKALKGIAIVKELYPEAKPEDLKKHLTSLQKLSDEFAKHPELAEKIGINPAELTAGGALSEGQKIIARYAVENPAKFTAALTQLSSAGGEGSAISKEQIDKLLQDTTSAEYLVKVLKNPGIATSAIKALNDPEVQQRLQLLGINIGAGTDPASEKPLDIAELLSNPRARNFIDMIDANAKYFNEDTLELAAIILKKLPDETLKQLANGELKEFGFGEKLQIVGIMSDPQVVEIMKRNPDAFQGLMKIASASTDSPEIAKALSDVENSKIAYVNSKLMQWFPNAENDPMVAALCYIASYVITQYFPSITPEIEKAQSPVHLIGSLMKTNNPDAQDKDGQGRNGDAYAVR